MKPFMLAPKMLLLQQSLTPHLDSLTKVFRQLYSNFLGALPGILTGVLVFLVFLIVAAIGKRIIAKLAPRANADTGVVLLLSRVFYYGILILGILTALPATGLNVSALVAGLGLTGFAIGFALKDVLSNLLAGIMLLVYRPFHIGDHVKMGEHEGTITTIRMRDTVLRASDGRSIIIPNTKLITEVVVNNSTAQLSRDTLIVELADETKLAHARRIMLDALRGERDHAARVEPQISISHNPASDAGERLTLESSYWFDPRRTTRDAARESLARATRAALAGAGINANFIRTNPTTPNNPATNKPPTADEDEPGASKDTLL